MSSVGLSGLPLDSPYSGTATYARNLVPQLALAAPDFRFHLYGRHTALAAGNFVQVQVHSPLERWNRGPGPMARADKLAWESVSLPLASVRQRNSLLHSLYMAAPPVSASPLVVTIHDLIPLVVPGYHRSRQSALYSRLMAHFVKRARAIITVSEHSRADIVRVLEIPSSKVHVVYEAVDADMDVHVDDQALENVRSKYRLPERYVLTMGAERRKNIETVIQAWSRVQPQMERHEIKLVVLAKLPKPDALYPDIARLVAESGVGESVCLVDEVRAGDKPALYKGALVFAFPSLYEGFGLPPLEAMAVGTPVIASNATSLPEVVGNGGVLLAPRDVGQWAEALLAMVKNDGLRQEAIAAGHANLQRFSWQRAARETVQIYRASM